MWYAEADGDQCGRSSEALLCSGINEFSPQYLDDTDQRYGGCYMSSMSFPLCTSIRLINAM